MKKVLVVIWAVLVIFFICLTVNHVSNEKMINNYENQVYEENKITLFGFFEPYIKYYNQGDILYQQGQYKQAEEQFRKALDNGIKGERDCKARINIALSMIADTDMDNITEDNVDDVISILEDARNVLTEKGCAHESDNAGHNSDAQQLKNDIDKFIEQLRNQENGGGGKDSDSDDPQNPEKDPTENFKEKEKKIKELIGEGQKERNRSLVDPEEFNNIFENYYDGPTW